MRRAWALVALVLAGAAAGAGLGVLTTSRPAVPAACHAGVSGRPDPQCTPGRLNPAVSQSTVAHTICVPGWTRTVRPPASYTNALKVRQIRAYGYADIDPRHYEEDHLVPLELGGAPRDPRNLWPEPHTQSPAKDTAENALKADVCYGRRTLSQAQAKILADWGP